MGNESPVGEEETDCETCDGTGLVVHEERRGLELHDDVRPCPYCGPDEDYDREPSEREEADGGELMQQLIASAYLGARRAA